MAPESSVRTPRSVPVVCWAGALNTVSAAARKQKADGSRVEHITLLSPSPPPPRFQPLMMSRVALGEAVRRGSTPASSITAVPRPGSLPWVVETMMASPRFSSESCIAGKCSCLQGAYCYGAANEKVKECEKECKPDVEKICKDIKPGQGRIVRCLKQHQAELSADCSKCFKK